MTRIVLDGMKPCGTLQYAKINPAGHRFESDRRLQGKVRSQGFSSVPSASSSAFNSSVFISFSLESVDEVANNLRDGDLLLLCRLV